MDLSILANELRKILITWICKYFLVLDNVIDLEKLLYDCVHGPSHVAFNNDNSTFRIFFVFLPGFRDFLWQNHEGITMTLYSFVKAF